jgi:acetylornithine/N-succinyldiaminopimelate aminotransferase
MMTLNETVLKYPDPETTTDYLNIANRALLYLTSRPSVVMASGRGMYLVDTEGKRCLDFVGGWAVTCLGHSPEVIHAAIAGQSQLLVNASPAFLNKPMIELADLLTRISGLERVFFASTGAEANESAIKLARKYGAKHRNGAYEIVTAIKGFHGRTLTTRRVEDVPSGSILRVRSVSSAIHSSTNWLPTNSRNSLTIFATQFRIQ